MFKVPIYKTQDRESFINCFIDIIHHLHHHHSFKIHIFPLNRGWTCEDLFSIFLNPIPHSHPILLVPNPSSLYLSNFSLVFLLSFSPILPFLPLISTLLPPSLLAWPNNCNLFCLNLSCIIFKPHLFATSSLEILYCHLTLTIWSVFW